MYGIGFAEAKAAAPNKGFTHPVAADTPQSPNSCEGAEALQRTQQQQLLLLLAIHRSSAGPVERLRAPVEALAKLLLLLLLQLL